MGVVGQQNKGEEQNTGLVESNGTKDEAVYSFHIS